MAQEHYKQMLLYFLKTLIYIYIFFLRILHIYDCNAYSLTLTNAVESLPLDLFVLVHQSHTPSSLYPGTQKEQIQVVAGSL